MKKILVYSFFCFCLFFQSFGFAKGDYLVKINNKNFTEKQFKIWWHYWKKDNTPFPSTPQSFIDWILLSDEAKALGLDKEESYQKKIKIFKEVRSLLQLRYDEVEKKININPDTLYEFYKKNYAPSWYIRAIVSNNKEQMELLKKNIKNKSDFDVAFQTFRKTNQVKNLGWQRPAMIPNEFKKIILNAKKGDILGPVLFKGSYFILSVDDKKNASKEDFNKIHNSVAVKYKKYEEGRLTNILLKKLKKKYKIFVDWKTIEQIKPFQNIPNDIAKKEVVKIDSKVLTGEQLKKIIEKAISLRSKDKKISDERLKKFEKSIVNTTIDQTLTSIEGLNRHYENRVMKDVFWFYKRNRLITELESKIIAPEIKISEEDLKKYYKDNRKDFIKPATVKIAVIQTKDKKLINNAYKRIKNGEDFFEVAREIQFHGAQPKEMKIDSLVKEVRDTVLKMRQGTISSIIKYQDWFFIVKLIKKKQKREHKFETVKKSIRKILYQKRLTSLKESFLKQLREKSSVKINKKEWTKVKKSFSNKKEPKKNQKI